MKSLPSNADGMSPPIFSAKRHTSHASSPRRNDIGTAHQKMSPSRGSLGRPKQDTLRESKLDATPPRFTAAEAEHIRSTFYTWQRESPQVFRPSDFLSHSPPPPSSLWSPVAAAVDSPKSRAVIPKFSNVNDVDGYLFGVPATVHSPQAHVDSLMDSPRRPRSALQSFKTVKWAHRASVQGALPQSNTALKTCLVSYNSPTHVTRAIEAQLAHVGRLDAGLELKRCKSPSTNRRWL